MYEAGEGVCANKTRRQNTTTTNTNHNNDIQKKDGKRESAGEIKRKWEEEK